MARARADDPRPSAVRNSYTLQDGVQPDQFGWTDGEDEDVSDEVATILRDDGIMVLTSAVAVRVEPMDDGRLRLVVRTEDGEEQLEGSHLLAAIGRVPNTEALTLEAAGVGVDDRGFIKAVVDADSGQILGGTVLGSEGGEIMTMIQIAMLGELPHTAMADAIFTHPLLAEGLNTLFAMFDA